MKEIQESLNAKKIIKNIYQPNDNIPIYDISNGFWEDKGTYWLNIAPQDSEMWYLNHKNRLTAGNFGTAIGKSRFCTPENLPNSIINIKPRSMEERVKFSQLHGVKTESAGRKWYCETRNVQVAEVGLAVPKWETRIGASADGEIVGTNGIIEIKSPVEMYKPLTRHMDRVNNGWVPPPFYHSHIWDTHYAQIQGCMKIMDKKWCDYVVYATGSGLSYVERVKFDEKYWNKILWPGISSFLNNILDPLIDK